MDYTLSRSLAVPHLQQIQEHRLSLMMNADGEDSHGFYASEGFPDVTLSVCSDEQMRERLAHESAAKPLAQTA